MTVGIAAAAKGEGAMAQVKKTAVRAAILAAARRLFRTKGYIGTTLDEIAAAAHTSRANIYVYFRSKFALLYAVFVPWLETRLAALDVELAAIKDPGARMRHILTALWRDIPSQTNGFANNLMQALSTAARDERYSPEFLRAVEKRLADMIDRCLPRDARARIDSEALAHLAFMAFDGFAMHAHLKTGEPCGDDVIDTVCALLFPASAARQRAKAA
jgi:AcrR family transcriptional regulator